jgi:hypothetical protein
MKKRGEIEKVATAEEEDMQQMARNRRHVL